MSLKAILAPYSSPSAVRNLYGLVRDEVEIITGERASEILSRPGVLNPTLSYEEWREKIKWRSGEYDEAYAAIQASLTDGGGN